jgi:hypothetical protein
MGMFEIGGTKTLDETQVKTIKQHLSLVFVHEIDPSFPAEQQDKLNSIHNWSTDGEDKPVMRC